MAQNDHEAHTHGSMDIRVQEKTFAGFISFTKWTLVAIFIVLIFLALSNS